MYEKIHTVRYNVYVIKHALVLYTVNSNREHRHCQRSTVTVSTVSFQQLPFAQSTVNG